jgi:hypothetical protein
LQGAAAIAAMQAETTYVAAYLLATALVAPPDGICGLTYFSKEPCAIVSISVPLIPCSSPSFMTQYDNSSLITQPPQATSM